jgi:hypothetical protein
MPYRPTVFETPEQRWQRALFPVVAQMMAEQQMGPERARLEAATQPGGKIWVEEMDPGYLRAQMDAQAAKIAAQEAAARLAAGKLAIEQAMLGPRVGEKRASAARQFGAAEKYASDIRQAQALLGPQIAELGGRTAEHYGNVAEGQVLSQVRAGKLPFETELLGQQAWWIPEHARIEWTKLAQRKAEAAAKASGKGGGKGGGKDALDMAFDNYRMAMKSGAGVVTEITPEGKFAYAKPLDPAAWQSIVLEQANLGATLRDAKRPPDKDESPQEYARRLAKAKAIEDAMYQGTIYAPLAQAHAAPAKFPGGQPNPFLMALPPLEQALRETLESGQAFKVVRAMDAYAKAGPTPTGPEKGPGPEELKARRDKLVLARNQKQGEAAKKRTGASVMQGTPAASSLLAEAELADKQAQDYQDQIDQVTEELRTYAAQ